MRNLFVANQISTTRPNREHELTRYWGSSCATWNGRRQRNKPSSQAQIPLRSHRAPLFSSQPAHADCAPKHHSLPQHANVHLAHAHRCSYLQKWSELYVNFGPRWWRPCSLEPSSSEPWDASIACWIPRWPGRAGQTWDKTRTPPRSRPSLTFIHTHTKKKIQPKVIWQPKACYCLPGVNAKTGWR